MKKYLTTISIIFTIQFVIAKNKVDTIIIKYVDTTASLVKEQNILNHYNQILESTNSQLNMWSNPYAFLVSVLSFIIAFLAIVATVIFYFQSQDFKKQQRISLRNNYKLLQQAITKNENDINNVMNSYEEYISLKNRELQELTDKIRNEIDKLIEKNSQTPDSKITDEINALQNEVENLNQQTVNCGNPNCLLSFNIPRFVNKSFSRITNSRRGANKPTFVTYKCPHCHTDKNIMY